MYSCDISGMSREIMKMDGRDSVECQSWENKDIDGIIGCDLNYNNVKLVNSIIYSNVKRSKNVNLGRG